MMNVVKLQFEIVKLHVLCIDVEFIDEQEWAVVNLQHIL